MNSNKNKRKRASIKNDMAKGEVLIPLSELPLCDFMPNSNRGKRYGYHTIWYWYRRDGLETKKPAFQARGTTKSAVLRFLAKRGG